MTKEQHYSTLYAVQDKVLALVTEYAHEFYLTGGTALSRFYLNHRYSDDLDFFTSEVHVFPELVKELCQKLGVFRMQVDSRDFKRVVLEEANVQLKLDFVADRVPRIGLPVMKFGYNIDTVRNILSNKIGAILGRDEPRDLADVLGIAKKYSFGWDVILEEARKKELFEVSELESRLVSFPCSLMAQVPYFDKSLVEKDSRDLPRLIADMMSYGKNTLAGEEALEL